MPVSTSLGHLEQVIVPLWASAAPLVKGKREEKEFWARIFLSWKSSLEQMPKDSGLGAAEMREGREIKALKVDLHSATQGQPPGRCEAMH